MTFEQSGEFLYVRQKATTVHNLRDDFPRARTEFIKKCAKAGALDNVLPMYPLNRAKREGILPSCLAVHHKCPLSGGGTNDESNFIILLSDDHAEVHFVYDRMLIGVKEGEALLLPSYGFEEKDIFLPKGFKVELSDKEMFRKRQPKKRSYRSEMNIALLHIKNNVLMR